MRRIWWGLFSSIRVLFVPLLNILLEKEMATHSSILWLAYACPLVKCLSRNEESQAKRNLQFRVNKFQVTNFRSIQPQTSRARIRPSIPWLKESGWLRGRHEKWDLKPKAGICLGSLSLVCSFYAQSCPTLCDPMDHSSPGSSVHGILQARTLEWVAILSFRGSSWPRDRACISHVSCIGRQVLYH